MYDSPQLLKLDVVLIEAEIKVTVNMAYIVFSGQCPDSNRISRINIKNKKNTKENIFIYLYYYIFARWTCAGVARKIHDIRVIK